MVTKLQQYTADHRYLLEVIARAAGFTAPVAIELDQFAAPLLKAARKGALLPIDGVLVRDWNPDFRDLHAGIQLGMRLYEVEGIRFVKVRFNYNDQANVWGLDFVAVDRKDYRRLYKTALRCRRDAEPAGQPPVLEVGQAEVLWKNTIGYLEPANLRRICAYGGRAKRGVLLMGPPGNGKTSACRWLWEACRQRNWQWRLVTPDTYQQARHSCNPQEAVRELFSVEGRGIVFFDDMDLALRDRETVQETDDQAVFLGALDGISVQEGVVFVFTTNCAPELIDRAFKRPGRLDLVLHFKAPNATMRRQLIERWHEAIRAHLELDAVIASTEGVIFAEIEELKNLLLMHYLDTECWDWRWALDQFEANRQELTNRPRRCVGFAEHLLQPHLHGAVDGNGT